MADMLASRTEENRQETERAFYLRFYREHVTANGYRAVEIDAENPPPSIEDWHLIERGYPASAAHFASTFTCEGIRYVRRFEWRDGWGSTFYLVKCRREIAVYSPAQVFEALA